MTSTMERPSPFEPDYVVPPGETLADILEERGLTQTDLAQRLGVSLKHVNHIVKGTASISAELALGLETVLGAPAEFWLKRESLYRGDLARHGRREELEQAVGWAKRFPIADLQEHNLVDREAKGADLVEELLRFFAVASPTQLEEPSVAFRKSLKFKSDPNALRAWLRWGDILASDIQCQPYNESRFQLALQQIRGLTCLGPDEWEKPFRELCADAGVAVVTTPHFSAVRANGAARWASATKAVIQLSLRYKWEDIFWFSFFHEAAHILLHRKKDIFVEPSRGKDLDDVDPEAKRLEDEADRFAATTLIPRRFEAQLRTMGPGDHAAVKSFAATLGISPAIVVGRLQHETGIYNQGRQLRRQFEFASP